jgi:phosphatase and actin regulator 4
MSIRVSGVYLVPSPGQPSSPEKSDSPGSGGIVAVVKPKSLAIVTPQRSNSLDYLNFEEKRQIIASSLSLSEFLHRGPAAAAVAAKGVAATKVIVGEFKVWGVESNLYCPRVNLRPQHTAGAQPM